jgi:AraC-like DNA-binding protein
MDLVYNVLILPLIVYISKKIYQQEVPDEINPIEKEEVACDIPLTSNFDISELIVEKQYYLIENLNLDTLASFIGTNRTYLSRIINSELNTNFYDYINTFRIEHAESLLKDIDCKLSIEQVAYDSGFRSYSTFNRFFKKRYDTTPGAFRARVTLSEAPN